MMSFFVMGGYGFYVWMAYGVALTILGVALGMAFFQLRKAKKQWI